jgi:molybdopterin-containing oxidoreductase family iron-sulfur binding subunit
MEKKYWKGLEEMQQTPEHKAQVQNEFSEELPLVEMFSDSLTSKSTGRRDFLKVMGFSVAAATLAASCEIPVRKAIPYVIKPEEVVPGVANWYASTYSDGGEYCSIIVKSREGRPIKIEGNHHSEITKGGTSARVQGSVLSLYDTARATTPSMGGAEATWDKIDAAIKSELAKGSAAIVTSSILSPTTKSVIADFIAKYPGSKHVTYDAQSYSGILTANESNFGKRALASYNFDKSNVIVSFGADFLGTWISPTEFTKQYVQGRKLNNGKMEMSKHFQIESNLSLTGANADERIVIHPTEEGLAVVGLYNILNGGTSNIKGLDKAAKALAAAEKGTTLVVSGSNDANIQMVVNHINTMLGNYGSTVDINHHANYAQSNDAEVALLIEDMNAGKYATVMLLGCNPAYDYPTQKFAEAIKKVACRISFNDRMDETTKLCNYHTPDHHYLESWNDAEPKAGHYSICQPVIAPLFKTRQFQDSLLKWIDCPSDYYSYLQENWTKNILKGDVNDWDNAVKMGVFSGAASAAPKNEDKPAAKTEEKKSTASASSAKGDINTAIAAISGTYSGKKNSMAVVLYEKVAIGNGKNSNNPWLMEMPDPITKTTWDNYACVSYDTALKLGLLENNGSLFSDHKPVWDAKETKMVTIKVGNTTIKLPSLVQPGLANDTIAIAVGYGRTAAGKVGNGVGQNAYPFKTWNGSTWISTAFDAQVTVTNDTFTLAQTQLHHSYEGRRVIKETTLKSHQANPKAVNEDREEIKAMMTTLYGPDKRYGDHKYEGHKWHMAIDLNSCTGCGNCTIACQSENNVSVVGKNHVVRGHEMHWMRIDRYYSVSDGKEGYNTMEKNINAHPDFQNVQVVFQPMMCQHCTNAPCENVCPVNATNHSSEGLNQMAYNRCIGTRYCANNCPYKVRRFNWMDWNGADSFEDNMMEEIEVLGMAENLTRMVLNPDVTVRARGVIEKCSFCVQRIQEGKLEAKKNNMMLADGMIKSACQSSCPADAIVFGDINNKESEVRKIYDAEDESRLYFVLEEIHVQPSVGYLAKVRNADGAASWLESKGEHHHEEKHEGKKEHA